MGDGWALGYLEFTCEEITHNDTIQRIKLIEGEQFTDGAISFLIVSPGIIRLQLLGQYRAYTIEPSLI